MSQVTPACAEPTRKYPEGRTGTSAGYQAHRKAGEPTCRLCAEAHSARCARRKLNLSPDALARERARATEGARRRRDANPDTAPACIVPTPEYPEGCRGTADGYAAHIDATQVPCQPCREASAAHDYGPACARPTRKYPNGRTGTRSGYLAHFYVGEEACDSCLKGGASAQAQLREDDPDLTLRGNLWYKYRLSLEAYEDMLRAQDGKCAICESASPADIRASRFHVDHDHACCPGSRSCGKCVRGLLCRGCNTALGNFGDDPARLLAAAAYLMTTRTEVADA